MAGHSVCWQSENDFHRSRILNHHWPDVTLIGDVQDVRADQFVQPELITGGFPCQDLSVAGKRQGLQGSQSGFWWEFHRILSEFTDTQWCLIENVPGLLSCNEGRDFAVLLRSLADIGFLDGGIAWRVLDSSHFNVPQRRKRLFILASRDPSGGCPAEVLALTEGSEGDTGAFKQARVFSPNYFPKSTRVDPVAYRKAQKAHDPNDCERWEMAEMSNTLTAHGTTTDLVAYNVYPLPGQGEFLSATETSLGNLGGRYSQSERGTRVVGAGLKPRRLTPIECERLQGFPDNWTAYGSSAPSGTVILQGEEALYPVPDTPRYRALGNAVTVPVAEWLGYRLSEKQNYNTHDTLLPTHTQIERNR